MLGLMTEGAVGGRMVALEGAATAGAYEALVPGAHELEMAMLERLAALLDVDGVRLTPLAVFEEDEPCAVLAQEREAGLDGRFTV